MLLGIHKLGLQAHYTCSKWFGDGGVLRRKCSFFVRVQPCPAEPHGAAGVQSSGDTRVVHDTDYGDRIEQDCKHDVLHFTTCMS